MFLADFRNSTDEYFVRTVLRSCLIIILATALAQVLFLGVMAFSYLFISAPVTDLVLRLLQSFSVFSIVDLFIFSVAIFYRTLNLLEWVVCLSFVMSVATIDYWLRVIHGPIKDMHSFARIHKISFLKSTCVLYPFYFNAYTAYFFVTLKRILLPLTFIFIASDFRILVPRLVEAGLSLEAFILFASLIISLHLLSAKEGDQ